MITVYYTFWFQVCVEQWVAQWAGGLSIGVTCMTPSDKTPSTIGGVKEPTWYIMGKCMILHYLYYAYFVVVYKMCVLFC